MGSISHRIRDRYIYRSLATKGTHETASDVEFSLTTRFDRRARVRKSCSDGDIIINHRRYDHRRSIGCKRISRYARYGCTFYIYRRSTVNDFQCQRSSRRTVCLRTWLFSQCTANDKYLPC